eukprot:630774-Pyramimonas_sp.AAC.1
MDRGRCPPQNVASAAPLGGGNPRFPMETGPVANPLPLNPCLRSPDSSLCPGEVPEGPQRGA